MRLYSDEQFKHEVNLKEIEILYDKRFDFYYNLNGQAIKGRKSSSHTAFFDNRIKYDTLYSQNEYAISNEDLGRNSFRLKFNKEKKLQRISFTQFWGIELKKIEGKIIIRTRFLPETPIENYSEAVIKKEKTKIDKFYKFPNLAESMKIILSFFDKKSSEHEEVESWFTE